MNTTNEVNEMNREELEEQLAQCGMHAPSGFSDQVMRTVRQRAEAREKKQVLNWWPAGGSWLMPALAGAAAMLLVWMGIHLFETQQTPVATGGQHMVVTFELHAPDAKTVELAGTFNEWSVGAIELTGPDVTGNWSVEVPLPEGRHEYLFLVDGREWITDPSAMAYRDDGFGSRNAVMEL